MPTSITALVPGVARRPTTRALVARMCVCCGEQPVRLDHHAALFCRDCLRRATPHDVRDPYDDLGEGD